VSKRAFSAAEGPTFMHRAPQHDQLMSECRVLGFEAAFRIKWCGHDGQHESSAIMLR
jgi:hypothetical protein